MDSLRVSEGGGFSTVSIGKKLTMDSLPAPASVKINMCMGKITKDNRESSIVPYSLSGASIFCLKETQKFSNRANVFL